jgi:hypothetical protein
LGENQSTIRTRPSCRLFDFSGFSTLKVKEKSSGFRRAVAMLGGQANVADLARTILFFDQEETRRRLAFDYYAAGAAAPRAAEPGTAENV